MMVVVARIVAFANQKGGVAKTTSAVNVAAALVERGRRVLLVDLDAQGCASFSLGLDPEDLAVSVADVVIDGASIAEVVVTTADGVDLLPATTALFGADQALSGVAGREFAVRRALLPLVDDYDWIVIDCSPSLGILTVGALTASDLVVVPLQCETLSHRGVSQLMETIADVRRLVNPELQVAGILPTIYDGRTTHARAVLADLPQRYGVPVLPPVTRSIRFAEAPATGRSILATAGRSRGAHEYRAIAEILDQPASGD